MKRHSEEDDFVESLEVSARTVNEAIEKALHRLGKTRDEVEISVLTEGSRGILGIGGEEARILVSPREPVAPPPAVVPRPTPPMSTADVAETARDILETVLSGMQTPAEVELLPLPPTAADEGFQALLDIVGAEDVGILIGRRGETLGALQFLLTLMVSKKVGKWSKVLVDVEGYRQRREASLRSLATRIALRVQQTRQPMPLEAMPANERRIVHITLQDHPAVTTSSTGEGDERHVVILPKS
jgi:spoIIIJ-associated protein